MKKILALFAIATLCRPLWAGMDPLERVADELAAGIENAGESRVAVMGLANPGQPSSDGPKVVSERLTTFLAQNPKLHLIERGQITQILHELHLSETGLMAPTTASRVGRVLGADIIVTGTLIDLENDQTELNARALYAGSGRVISASRTILNREWAVPNRLNNTKPRRKEDRF